MFAILAAILFAVAVIFDLTATSGGSGRTAGAVPVLPPAVSRGPPAAPGVRLSPHRALRVPCPVPQLVVSAEGSVVVHGVGMLFPRYR